jgi:hypothetical protein
LIYVSLDSVASQIGIAAEVFLSVF